MIYAWNIKTYRFSLKTNLISHHLAYQDSLSCCLHILLKNKKNRRYFFSCEWLVSVITDGILISQQPLITWTVSPWHLLCGTDIGLMWTWVWSLWEMRHVSSLERDVCYTHKHTHTHTHTLQGFVCEPAGYLSQNSSVSTTPYLHTHTLKGAHAVLCVRSDPRSARIGDHTVLHDI